MARTRLSYLPVFKNIVDHAVRTASWVVVVAPTGSDCLSDLRTVGLGCYPMGTVHVGRTAILPNEARLTIAGLDSEVVAKGYDVVFLGFEDQNRDHETIRREQWREKARKVLTSGDEDGFLRTA